MNNNRDDNGRFVKGHEPTFFKHKPGTNVGRPKSLKGEVRDALALAEDAMPDIIKVMIARAKNPYDRDSQRASEYLIDRIYGKSSQPIAGAGDIVFRVVYDKVVSDAL